MTVDIAIQLRDVSKHFGFGKKKVAVLKQIDLDVPKGSIFGLLGPSGCGKTTLLSCVVGRHRIDKGSIRVFDECPGSAKCGIPGPGVGYMPQDLALMGDLTAKETLEYFGRIYKMNKDKIKQRINFLLEFLSIPKNWKLIKNLSGGQQRRVSLAIAFLHEPPLLILDEPTVGVDPLLRKNIWKHLIEMSQSGDITTVITTHYTEEAILANAVGFMRDGRILNSGDPQSLLNRYNLSSLEEVFLHLCENESSIKNNSLSGRYSDEETEKKVLCNSLLLNSNPIKTVEIVCQLQHQQQRPVKDKPPKCHSMAMPSLSTITALTTKNFNKLRREWLILAVQFLLPVVLVTLICLATEKNPHSLKIAVVNGDFLMGKKFLTYIDKTVVHQVAVDDITAAENMVLRGEAWGLIHIWKNFTMALSKRFLTDGNLTETDFLASSVHVRMDTTSVLLLYSVQFSIVEAMQQLGKDMDGNYGFNFEKMKMPLRFGKPIYGSDNRNLTGFLIPGAVITLIFFVAFGLTSMEFATEKKQGLLDRSYVAGVNTVDLICGHIASQLIIMIIQVSLVLFCVIVIFQFPCEGSVILVIFLTLLQGLCGMMCGYFVSTLFQNEYALVVIGLGGLFNAIIMSGSVWPVEAMPDFMATFSQILPQTYAVEALRSILSRGWDISFTVVWRGYLMSAIWTVIFMICSFISIRLKR